ncbi:MAG: hypothetical protein ABSA78_22890 [Candidatus Sulfotelmatobacter sp.]
MFSAFSFGKIIKTVLPGVILTAALLLVLEGFWTLWRPQAGFLMGSIPKEWITPVTAALIPVSMLLGFFLNTFAWMVLNPRMRKRSEVKLDNMPHSVLRSKLCERLWSESSEHFKLAPPLDQSPRLDRPQLEYYYLPWVKLTNLNYLWESYFCWYEFHINSACAVLVLGPAAAFLVCVKLRACSFPLLILVLLFLVSSWALYSVLTRAAVRNLASYEKNLMLLITGSLAEASQHAQLPAADVDDVIGPQS